MKKYNLYKIKMQHFSPKDSEEGIVGFLYAKNDEQVYEFLKTDPKFDNLHILNCWDDKENDDITFKKSLLKHQGEINNDDIEVHDLYYGCTLYGWEIICEEFNLKFDTFVNVLQKNGIFKNITNFEYE